ncbi:MAG: leucine-rich repeat domain-containing protein [Firmicutes bacterium]|nr:leucine-rich repeat domain-containing protein [Bacillota bacterium]
MQSRVDLRNYIATTFLSNSDEDQRHGDLAFNTADYLYILSAPEVSEFHVAERMISATDSALMDGAFQNRRRDDYANRTGTTRYFLRTAYNSERSVYSIESNGDSDDTSARRNDYSLCPAMRLHSHVLQHMDCNIQPVRNQYDRIIYHTLQFGEKDKSHVGSELNLYLEGLYQSGELDDKATGRLWTSAAITSGGAFTPRKNPEFEVDGQKFIRKITTRDDSNIQYSTRERAPENGTARWVKVEPITWKIRNWDDLSTDINPDGNGSNTIIELVSDQAIMSNIPFYPAGGDRNRNMWQNSTIRGFLNGINVNNITENGNLDYTAPRGGDFTQCGNFLEESFDLTREPVYEYQVPEGQTEICKSAFEGCIALQKIIIPSSVEKIGENAFRGCGFKYAYKLNSNGYQVFAKELPENQNEITEIVNIEQTTKVFSNFDASQIVKHNPDDLDALVKRLVKDKYVLPHSFVLELSKNGLLDRLSQNTNFKFFKNELKDYMDDIEDLNEHYLLHFMKFALSLGCFSEEKIKDRNGVETNKPLAQTASTLLSNILRDETFSLYNFQDNFTSLPLGTKPNQDFVKYLTKKNDQNEPNYELLRSMEYRMEGIFSKVMFDFKAASGYRRGFGEDGKPKTFSWEDAFRNFYYRTKYIGICDDSIDIAEYFASKSGIDQEVFDAARDNRLLAKRKNIPSHILGKPLSEKTLLEQIEDIAQDTEDELEHSKRFMYEMLDKYDPANAIMGDLVDCCGSLTSNHYGYYIAEASMVAPDVQNLVVRDRNKDDKIIAKGTIYVNKQEGYAVINEFDVNDSEWYMEQYREPIFQAFVRGINAFVEEYNKQNPENPFKQFNVGMGCNKLSTETRRFPMVDAQDNLLRTPEDYCFNDAKEQQHIFYRLAEPEVEPEPEIVEPAEETIKREYYKVLDRIDRIDCIIQQIIQQSPEPAGSFYEMDPDRAHELARIEHHAREQHARNPLAFPGYFEVGPYGRENMNIDFSELQPTFEYLNIEEQERNEMRQENRRLTRLNPIFNNVRQIVNDFMRGQNREQAQIQQEERVVDRY